MVMDGYALRLSLDLICAMSTTIWIGQDMYDHVPVVPVSGEGAVMGCDTPCLRGR